RRDLAVNRLRPLGDDPGQPPPGPPCQNPLHKGIADAHGQFTGIAEPYVDSGLPQHLCPTARNVTGIVPRNHHLANAGLDEGKRTWWLLAEMATRLKRDIHRCAAHINAAPPA